MSSFEGAMLSFLDHIFTTFTNSATTVVLLSTELIAATGSMRRTMAAVYDDGVPSTFFTIQWITPLCTSPAMMTKSTPTVTTEVELKPSRASSAFNTPVT